MTYIVDFFQRLTSKNNIGVLIYLFLNSILIIAIFSGGFNSLGGAFLGIFAYALSVTIALSPIGEWLLRYQTGCKKIKDKEQLNRLMPLFQSVLSQARKIEPNISKDVQLYISNHKEPNAFATGRKTICLTKGFLSYSDEQIKATFAHELGHLAHKDTDLILLVGVGNFIVTAIYVSLRVFYYMVAFFTSLIRGNAETLILTFFIDLIIIAIMWVWTKIGIALVMHSNRQNEYLADEFAVKCGYGNELIEVMSTFDGKAAKGLWASLASSHPEPSDRIARIKDNRKMPSIHREQNIASEKMTDQYNNIDDSRIANSKTTYMEDDNLGLSEIKTINWKGGVYKGEVTELNGNIVPNGIGELKLANGAHYNGDWVNGTPSGKAKIKYSDGGQYEGSCIAGKRNGAGTYIYPDGKKVSGKWLNGKLVSTVDEIELNLDESIKESYTLEELFMLEIEGKEWASKKIAELREAGLNDNEFASTKMAVYEREAENGNPVAQFWTGFLYETWYEDIEKAKFWYEEAAAKGNAKAMMELSVGYNLNSLDPERTLFGRFGDDPKKSIMLLINAANTGNALALERLGDEYLSGYKGLINKDIDKALLLYKKAAKQGNYRAWLSIADIYGTYYGFEDYYDYSKTKKILDQLLKVGDEEIVLKAQERLLSLEKTNEVALMLNITSDEFEQSTEKPTCSSCSSPLKAGAKFCSICGQFQ